MTVQIRDSDGTVRLSGDLLATGGATGDVLTQQADGTYSPAAGGGGSAVTCVLEAQIDVKTQAEHLFNWSDLYNNSEDFDPLAAIPDGLGLTFTFVGNDNTITATEAGVWAFTLGFNIGTDATWVGVVNLDTSLYAQRTLVAAETASGGSASLCEVVNVPAGWSIAPSVTVTTAATAGALFSDCYLNIVRLG